MSTYAQLTAQQRESFFQYEAARYLYNEKEGLFPFIQFEFILTHSCVIELAARYLWFNIEALQDVAISAMGAQRCMRFTKLAEGTE